MNVELLEKVKQHILEEPRRLVMGRVKLEGEPGTTPKPNSLMPIYAAGNTYESKQKFPDCGTMACIMGWARILDPVAARDGGFGRLCDASTWPKRFRNRYAKAKTPIMRAKIAAARIDHFIKTQGAE